MKKGFKDILFIRLIVFVLVLLTNLSSFGQNRLRFGHLPHKNFPRTEYSGQQQNFGIIESQEGTILIANNSSVLEFNGNSWTNIMKDEGAPKSLHLTASGRVLVGADNDFGYLVFDGLGRKKYKSLAADIDKDLIGKIWNIYGNKEEYYFIAEKAIFIYTEEKGIETVLYPDGFTRDNSSKLNENLFISLVMKEVGSDKKSHNHLLFNTKTKQFDKFLPEVKAFQELTAVKFIMPWKDANHYLAITQTGEAYSINHVTKEQFKMETFSIGVKDVFLSIKNYDGLLIFSTEKNGVFIFDHLGQLIRQINNKDGLIDNSVNYCYVDSQKNLWAATANGISFIELSSPISYFDKSDGITSKLEDIASLDNNIYLASNDIFNLDLNSKKTKIEGLNFGQPSFNFTKIHIDGEERILIVGYDGIYSLGKDKKLVSEIPNLYAWKILQSTQDSNRIYIGTEGNGVASAYWNGKNFDLEIIYKNTGELVRDIIEFDKQVYFGYKEKGLTRLDTTKTLEENTLSGLNKNNLTDFALTNFQGRLYVGTANGLYYLEKGETELKAFHEFNLDQSKLYVHRVFNEDNKRLWLVLFYNNDSKSGDEKPVFGYLEKGKDGIWKFVTAPFKYFSNDIVQGFTKDDNGNIWLGGDGGTYIVSPEQFDQLNRPFKINLYEFVVNSDSTLFYNYNNFSGSIADIEYTRNNIKVFASAQSYYGGGNNVFRFRLIGKSDEWSNWSEMNWSEYQNLSEGTYTLEVQAKDYYDNESEVVSVTFTILPPWYRTWYAIVLYVLGAIFLIYIIIRLSLQRVKKQNERLEIIVKERTAEIAKQNDVLEEQKGEIEIKNKDILDSIKYAKRIQDSILPHDEKMVKMFTDYFVLFKPKDIVSGDFYWAEKIKGKSLFAAVDCTGHGVPGAMVSVVGNNGLNRSVKEFNLVKPGDILNQLREIVIEAFNASSNNEVKDGMDIALCSIDYENLILEYSGANNPCVIFRDGEIIETKADKQPIGQFFKKTPFVNNVIELKKGDIIYVYTDGYVDQFGGEKGKKLKSRPFKNLLMDLHTLPMEEQHKKLDTLFEEWRGEHEQIDDVCVFGVKI